MSFDGFGDEAFAFYEGLSADNSRDYWTANKDRYERHVREPMLALVAELEDEFGESKVFRPHRTSASARTRRPTRTTRARSRPAAPSTSRSTRTA